MTSIQPEVQCGGAGRWFATTHWSTVLAAGGTPSIAAAEALERLCRAYWFPYDRHWAEAMLEVVLRRLRGEFDGQAARFDELKPFLLGEPEAEAYTLVAQRLQISEQRRGQRAGVAVRHLAAGEDPGQLCPLCAIGKLLAGRPTAGCGRRRQARGRSLEH